MGNIKANGCAKRSRSCPSMMFHPRTTPLISLRLACAALRAPDAVAHQLRARRGGELHPPQVSRTAELPIAPFCTGKGRPIVRCSHTDAMLISLPLAAGSEKSKVLLTTGAGPSVHQSISPPPKGGRAGGRATLAQVGAEHKASSPSHAAVLRGEPPPHDGPAGHPGPLPTGAHAGPLGARWAGTG